jgi:hypothetical protein
MIIQVEKKENYGRLLYYPINELALKLANLMNVKTFTSSNYNKIDDLGVFQIEII